MKPEEGKLTKRAIYYLNRTIKALEKTPDAYNQQEPGGFNTPSCGSPACICGWMYEFARRKANAKRREKIPYEAKSVGLTVGQFDRLFYRPDWPDKFRLQRSLYCSAITPAPVAIERIKHFIATNGNE